MTSQQRVQPPINPQQAAQYVQAYRQYFTTILNMSTDEGQNDAPNHPFTRNNALGMQFINSFPKKASEIQSDEGYMIMAIKNMLRNLDNFQRFNLPRYQAQYPAKLRAYQQTLATTSTTYSAVGRGKSSRCQAKTQSGKKCRNKCSGSRKYCYQH